MPLRSITFLLYFCGSSAAALVYPMIGVVCYIVLYHVFPETTWWGKSLQPLGIRYAFICGICVIIGTALNLHRLPLGKQAVHPVEWGVLLVFLAMLVSTATGTPWDYRTEYILDKMAKVVVFAMMLSHVVITRDRLWQLTLLFTLMALYLGHEARDAPPSAFTQNRLNGIGGPDFRESAGLAIHLFALMPFVVVVFRQPSWKLKLLAFLAGGYGVNAILLCRARSAFVGGVVAGLLALWYVPRRHRRWIFGVLTAGALGGVVLSDAWFWDRMVTIWSSAEERDQSAASRIEIWTAAWNLVKDRPLGVGIGHFEGQIGAYGPERVAGRDAHNTYVLCAAEVGIPGLLLYLGTLGLSWQTLARANRRARAMLTDPHLFELFVFAARLALVVYVVSGLFVSRLYTEGVWWFILLPACISRAVEAEIQAEARRLYVAYLPPDDEAAAQPLPAAAT